MPAKNDAISLSRADWAIVCKTLRAEMTSTADTRSLHGRIVDTLDEPSYKWDDPVPVVLGPRQQATFYTVLDIATAP